MIWTALVPLKASDARKTRLASALSVDERQVLSDRMADHVIATLAAHPGIGRIILLSDRQPRDWPHDWIADKGRGLNAELEAARVTCADQRVLIIHADLPTLCPTDLDALLAHDIAIAPDRHGKGTNALALADGTRVRLSFGQNSFACHLTQLPDAVVVRRSGLADDVDTPEDLIAII